MFSLVVFLCSYGLHGTAGPPASVPGIASLSRGPCAPSVERGGLEPADTAAVDENLRDRAFAPPLAGR